MESGQKDTFWLLLFVLGLASLETLAFLDVDVMRLKGCFLFVLQEFILGICRVLLDVHRGSLSQVHVLLAVNPALLDFCETVLRWALTLNLVEE